MPSFFSNSAIISDCLRLNSSGEILTMRTKEPLEARPPCLELVLVVDVVLNAIVLDVVVVE